MATKKKLLEAAAGSAGGAAGPLDVTDVFSAYAYDGTGATQSITNNINLSGEGGLVWIKERGAAANHYLFDTERGASYNLRSNLTNASQSTTWFTSFNSDGFTVSGSSVLNGSGDSLAAWTFRKAENFFDIVKYTGDRESGNLTINHNLGSVPGMIIVKCLDDAQHWSVYHRSRGANQGAFLNLTNAWGSLTDFPSTPTSTQFTVGTDSRVNFTGREYVAYIFAHHAGTGTFGPDEDKDIIFCGSHDNSSTDFVNLGWQPEFVMFKRRDTTSSWALNDTLRGYSTGHWKLLRADDDTAESSIGSGYGIVSNGFKCTGFGTGDYIFMAIRRGPLIPPTDATEVFDVQTYTGANAGQEISTGFRTDFTLIKDRTDTANSWEAWDRLRGPNYLFPNSTVANGPFNHYGIDQNDGFTFLSNDNYSNSLNQDFITYNWQRARGYFDIVTWTSTATSGNPQTLVHNLGVVPEMIWLKCTSTAKDWQVYHSSLGYQYRGILNSSGYFFSAGVGAWNSAPTATTFKAGDDSEFGGASRTYIAYLFASLDGVSKTDAVTVSGSDVTVDCGFSSSPRLVIIKNRDAAGNWFVINSATGINAGNDPYLVLNNDAAETTTLDLIDPTSSGFTINQSVMGNGTFIYYAVA